MGGGYILGVPRLPLSPLALRKLRGQGPARSLGMTEVKGHFAALKGRSFTTKPTTTKPTTTKTTNHESQASAKPPTSPSTRHPALRRVSLYSCRGAAKRKPGRASARRVCTNGCGENKDTKRFSREFPEAAWQRKRCRGPRSSLGFARDFACGLIRPHNGSTSTPPQSRCASSESLRKTGL